MKKMMNDTCTGIVVVFLFSLQRYIFFSKTEPKTTQNLSKT